VENIDDVDDTTPEGDNITSKTHTDNQNTQYPFRASAQGGMAAAKPPKAIDNKNKSAKKKLKKKKLQLDTKVYEFPAFNSNSPGSIGKNNTDLLVLRFLEKEA